MMQCLSSLPADVDWSLLAAGAFAGKGWCDAHLRPIHAGAHACTAAVEVLRYG